MTNIVQLNDLRDQGIRLPNNHICVGGGCSITVTADRVYDRILVTHRLGDRGSSQTFDDGLVKGSADEFSRMASAALMKMHIQDGGSPDPKSFRLTAKKVTPYISPNDAINIATEIFGCTGQRVTIKTGGQKSRVSVEEPEENHSPQDSANAHQFARQYGNLPIYGCGCNICHSEREGRCFICARSSVGRMGEEGMGVLLCEEHLKQNQPDVKAKECAQCGGVAMFKEDRLAHSNGQVKGWIWVCAKHSKGA